MKNFLFVLLLFFSTVWAFAQDNEPETYFWNTTSLSGSIHERYKFVFGQKIHYNLNNNKLEYSHFDMACYKQISSHITLGAGFRNTYSKKSYGWQNELRYMAYGIYSGQLNEIKTQITNRLEYRTFDIGKSHYRYYNKLNVEFPLSVSAHNLKPYLTEELFIKLNDENLHLVRWYAGFYLLDTKHVQSDLFYCYNIQKSWPRWTRANVVGLNLRFVI